MKKYALHHGQHFGATEVHHGRDLQAGDVLYTWFEARTITGFEAHPGLPGQPARVALSGDLGITVFDNDALFFIPVETH